MSVNTDWHKSSFTRNDCVEMRATSDGEVLVRDSKDPGGAILAFPAAAFKDFLDGAQKGEFDLSRL